MIWKNGGMNMMKDEKIDRIIILENKLKANLKRNTCPQCGRTYLMKIVKDGSVIEPCPVCLGLFEK